MKTLEEIINEAKKKLNIQVDIAPERMSVLRDIMDGKISPEEGKQLVKNQYKKKL